MSAERALRSPETLSNPRLARRFWIRVELWRKARWLEGAKREGLTLSEFVRRGADARAESLGIRMRPISAVST